MKSILSSLIVGLLAACMGGTPIDEPPAPSEETQMTTCPVHSPSDVAMWINAMPGPNSNPTLITQFKVIAPTPGYSFALKVLEVMESFPPQYVFELTTTPPDGIVTQVETETEVRLELPNFEYSEIASATVKCGAETLFHLDEVITAH